MECLSSFQQHYKNAPVLSWRDQDVLVMWVWIMQHQHVLVFSWKCTCIYVVDRNKTKQLNINHPRQRQRLQYPVCEESACGLQRWHNTTSAENSLTLQLKRICFALFFILADICGGSCFVGGDTQPVTDACILTLNYFYTKLVLFILLINYYSRDGPLYFICEYVCTRVCVR